TVNYRLSWKYAGKAECFDGNSAACFFDKEKDGYRQGSETCSLSMEVKKSDGRFKILKITGISCNS
ncbi:MAG TPA: hypothetical protein VHO66_06670, partial [Ruminiclostridium sp.]|nr:hypothetical protein [Ruminiclostridium sp.]